MNEREIRGLEIRERRYRVSLGSQLYVDVLPSGRRVYRARIGNSFRHIGDIPETSLKHARAAVPRLVASAVDVERGGGGGLFKDAARRYLVEIARHKAARTRSHAEYRVHHYLNPTLGNKPINRITAPDLLAVLRGIEQQGHAHTAQRVGILYGQIARHGIAGGHCERDVYQDIRGALRPQQPKRRPAITDPAELGGLLRAIDGFVGYTPVAIGLQLAPLLALRPGELRGGWWSEVDFRGAVWRIPADRMKMSDAHVVPLATQSIALLKRLREFHDGERMFPGIRDRSRPISDNTLNAALRQLGYTGDRVVCHGFRTTFSTLLNERGVNTDWIEAQLAHHAGGVRSVYNAAKYLAQRRVMMQEWADYLDELKG